MAPRTPPEDFVRQLKAWPDFRELRWNEAVARWEFIFTSAAGRPVSVFYGWDRNPMTGAPIEPHPVTGLAPFRDLTPDAQSEILRLGNATYLGNRHDGHGSWRESMDSARRHNRAVHRRRARERAETISTIIREVDLRRPWVKHHQRSRARQHFGPSARTDPSPTIQIVTPIGRPRR